jgi:GxxExxY protein
MSATLVLEKPGAGCRMSGVGLSTDKGTDKRKVALPHDALTYTIIGAAMRVHNQLGPGLKEAFYQRALTAELLSRGLNVVAEQPIEIGIDGVYVGQLYIDHLVENTVIVECKAVPHLLTDEEVAQVITYLNAKKPVGLLINFGRTWLERKRILPPKNAQPWKERIRRYVWLPPAPRSVYPLNSVESNPARVQHWTSANDTH